MNDIILNIYNIFSITIYYLSQVLLLKICIKYDIIHILIYHVIPTFAPYTSSSINAFPYKSYFHFLDKCLKQILSIFVKPHKNNSVKHHKGQICKTS